MSWKHDAGTSADRKALVAFGLFTFLCMAGVFALFSQTQLAHTEADERGRFADPGLASPKLIGKTITDAVERAAASVPDDQRDEGASTGSDEENVLRLR